MKKFIFQLSAVCLTAMLFVFTGCQDKDLYDPDYKPESPEVPSNADFSTTRSVKLNFDNVLSEGLITAFDVYAANPYKKVDGVWTKQDDISPIASGINVAGISDLKRTLPTYVGELYVSPTTLFAPTLMYAKVENNVATFTEMLLTNDDLGDDVTTRTYGTKAVDSYLSPTLSYSGGYYKPTVTLDYKGFPTTVKNAIIAAFPNGKKAEAKYYKDASIKIEQEDETDEGAELFLSVIHSDGTYNNSLMYFCYDGDKELSALTDAEKNSLRITSAFQFAKIGTNNSTLRAGDYIQLKYYDAATKKYVSKFPLGTKIGWVLSSNGFYTSTSKPKDGSSYTITTRGNSTSYPWYYSIPSWNPESSASDKNHTISFTATNEGTEYICFGFEDMRNDGKDKGDGDCNDVMFHIVSNPIKAIVPPPYIPEEGTVTTTEDKTGILAFEDNWPKLGDYDINDVVVKYASEITYVQKTEDGKPVGNVTLERTIDKFSIINDGADFHNAFSYKVGIDLSAIETIKVDGNVYSAVKDNNDGYIIDLCADVKALGALPKNYGIVTTFKAGEITQDDFNSEKSYPYGKAPYNPFIQPTNPYINSDAIEVHLPFYPPTGRADRSLFGTYNDASDVSKDIYYAAPEGTYYPFALHLAEVDDFGTVEGKPIEHTYPDYTGWVNGGCGTINADWYLNQAVQP